MAETRVIHPHGTRRRLRKHASTVIRVVPLGVVLPMIFSLDRSGRTTLLETMQGGRENGD
jgi:hypothetical protein